MSDKNPQPQNQPVRDPQAAVHTTPARSQVPLGERTYHYKVLATGAGPFVKDDVVTVEEIERAGHNVQHWLDAKAIEVTGDAPRQAGRPADRTADGAPTESALAAQGVIPAPGPSPLVKGDEDQSAGPIHKGTLTTPAKPDESAERDTAPTPPARNTPAKK